VSSSEQHLSYTDRRPAVDLRGPIGMQCLSDESVGFTIYNLGALLMENVEASICACLGSTVCQSLRIRLWQLTLDVELVSITVEHFGALCVQSRYGLSTSYQVSCPKGSYLEDNHCGCNF
jgi:hypothetical protein